MKEKFDIGNDMAVPSLKKIVVSTSFGSKIEDMDGSKKQELKETIQEVLAEISGQKPVFTQARKSISEFSSRKGKEIGAKVTLRKDRMEGFFKKMTAVVFPRTRDFKGIDPESVDEQGNLTVGLEDYTAFPEIEGEKGGNLFGLEVTFVTSAENKDKGFNLLKFLGIPFKGDKNK